MAQFHFDLFKMVDASRPKLLETLRGYVPRQTDPPYLMECPLSCEWHD